MRPRQWVKNLIISAPLVFSLNMFNWPLVQRLLVAFGVFCAAASAVYLLNDIVDLERDRAHPTKRSRPIAGCRSAISVPAGRSRP